MKKISVKFTIAAVLVTVISLVLYFASPVDALNILVNEPGPGSLGNQLNFSVRVDVEDIDVLPVQGVQIDIFNTANRATYFDRYASLPLTTTAEASYASGGPGNPALITVTTGTDWGYGYGYRYGYDSVGGTGAYNFGYGDGWGYSNSPYSGTTSITYNVKWISPAGWPAGDYKIEATVKASDAQSFVKTSSGFVLSAASGGGGGGGGGPAPSPTPGIISLLEKVSFNGVFYVSVTAPSSDGKALVFIEAGTQGLTAAKDALSKITILPVTAPPSMPQNTHAIGPVYDFGPSGANFNKPVTITLAYDPVKLISGANESNIYLAWWDSGANKWTALNSIVDTSSKKITAQVNHFTNFAILAPVSVFTPTPVKTTGFTLSQLNISPSEAGPGEEVTVSVLVTNTGEAAGNYDINFKVNNFLLTTKTVSLAAGASEVVGISLSRDILGAYTVSVDYLKGTLTVREAPAATIAEVSLAAPTFAANPAVPRSPVSPAAVATQAAADSGTTIPLYWLVMGIIAICIIITLVSWQVINRNKY